MELLTSQALLGRTTFVLITSGERRSPALLGLAKPCLPKSPALLVRAMLYLLTSPALLGRVKPGFLLMSPALLARG
jgi:hypothetical protein